MLLSFLRYFLYLFVAYQVVVRLVRKRWHFPAPAWIGRFLDSDLRRRVQSPYTIIERSRIGPGMRVLEIGCGSGAYTPFIARTAGPKGRLYAYDIQRSMLRQLQRKLSRPRYSDLSNILPIEGSAFMLPFPDTSIDLAYMITVLQEIPDKAAALDEIKRVLKPYGLVAVTEFLPDPDYPLRRTTLRNLREAGFVDLGHEGNLWHYTVTGRKQRATERMAVEG